MSAPPALTPTPGLVAIVQTLQESGHAAWAVGGAVRDGLAGLAPGDWDVATDARPETVRGLFRDTHPIGIEHGTVGVRIDGEVVEVTTFRLDVSTDGRRAVVRFGATLEEDLARRDFTINAIAWDPVGGEIVDPHAGRADLETGILRAVGDPERRLVEDYLRIPRAFRFAARFDLDYEPALERALAAHAAGVAELSGERVRDELLKTLAQCRSVSRALGDWRRFGALARLVPELAIAFGVEQNAYHADDVGTHSLLVADRVHPRRTFLRWVALLHDVGKPVTRERSPETGDWTFPGHAEVGGRLTEQAMRRLRFSAREIDRAAHLVRVHMDLLPADAGDAAFRRWIRRVGEENVWDLYRVQLADWWGNRARAEDPEPLVAMYRRIRSVLREDAALKVEDLAIGGRDLIDLGLDPGPRFGTILEELLERVLDDPTLNTRPRLLDLVREELPGEGVAT